MLTALGQQNAEHTLRLDGQSDTDTFEVFTLGSNGPDQRNYIINVLDTGASDDGVDELFVYGNATEDDTFMLRESAYIPNEDADRAGYVALIHGDEDRNAPVAIARYLSTVIPNADYMEVAGASHMLPVTQPDVLAKAIRAFVDGGTR